MSNYFILILHCLVQWKLAQAQSVTCESFGICEQTAQKCIHDTLSTPACSFPSGFVTSVDGYKRLLSHDYTTCVAANTSLANTTVESVSLQYFSVTPSIVSINVSWSLTESSGHYGGGYEVRMINGNDQTSFHFCVNDSNIRKATIRNLRYEHLDLFLRIDVIPYPNSVESEVTVSSPIRHDIDGCADIPHDGTICGEESYSRPVNLRVESCVCENVNKMLSITWDPPNVQLDTQLPDIYHIYLYNGSENGNIQSYFTVKGAYSVVLANLSATDSFFVEVVPYRLCAGLGNSDFDWRYLGCGKSTGMQQEKLLVDCDYLQSTESITTPTSTWYGGNGTEGLFNISGTNASYTPFIPVIVSVAIALNVALFIAVSLAVVICIKLYNHLKHKVYVGGFPSKTIHKVFVFYSPNMMESHIVYIQQHVICNLSEYFEVITPNDIDRGNISIWLENAVSSADSVLLVGGEEFCTEWEREERSPLLNSLELLISAAASMNDIAKFAIISMVENRKNVRIPENSYLHLMPVFLMGEKNCEMNKVYQFVTKSRGIEFAQEKDVDGNI